MAQRISRAKQSIKAAGHDLRACRLSEERAARLRVVLHVLYLIFNEGYTATLGARAAAPRADQRGDPADSRGAHGLLPDDGEVAGLLALMLLTDARRHCAHRARRRARSRSPSRTGAAGTDACISRRAWR